MKGGGAHVRVRGERIGQRLDQLRGEAVRSAHDDGAETYSRQPENLGSARRQHHDRLTGADPCEFAQTLGGRCFRRQHDRGATTAGGDSDGSSAAKIGQSALDRAEAYRLPGSRNGNYL